MFEENKDYQKEEEKKTIDNSTSEEMESHHEDENADPKSGKRKRKKEFVTKEEYDQLQDRYLKALNTAAHHENLSKYYRNEYDKMMKYRSQSLLEALLPSLDGFQLAFKYDAPTKEAQNYRLGFEFVYKLLLSALTSEGMNEIIPSVGESFDPSTCQVMDTVETNESTKVGKIAEVLLSGYKFKDRIVRPANVKIYTLAVQKENTEDSNSQTTNAKDCKN